MWFISVDDTSDSNHSYEVNDSSSTKKEAPPVSETDGAEIETAGWGGM